MSDLPKSTPPSPQPPEGTRASFFQQRQFQFVGPLPPPGMLEQYDKICPGAATRIIDAAYEEGVHRHAVENKALDANIEAMRRQFAEARVGQVFALIIAIAFVIVGGYVSIRGQPVSGTILGGVGLGGIVTAFIVGRSKLGEPNGPNEGDDQTNQKDA